MLLLGRKVPTPHCTYNFEKKSFIFGGKFLSIFAQKICKKEMFLVHAFSWISVNLHQSKQDNA